MGRATVSVEVDIADLDEDEVLAYADTIRASRITRETEALAKLAFAIEYQDFESARAHLDDFARSEPALATAVDLGRRRRR